MKLLKTLLEAEDIAFRSMNKKLDKIDRDIERLIPTLRSREIRVGVEFAKEIEPKSGKGMSEALLTVISKMTDVQEAIELVKFFQDRALQLEKKPKK